MGIKKNNFTSDWKWKLKTFKESGEKSGYDDFKNLFSRLVYNFVEAFNEKNIYLCKKNSEIWENLKYYIEDLSITYYSCLKIFKFNTGEFQNKIEIFKNLYKDEKTLYSRIIIMRWIYYHNMRILDNLDLDLEKMKEEISEDEIISKFSECIIEIDKENKYYEEDKDSQILKENIFINIFINRVKYYFYRFKIKNKILNDNLENDISKIAKVFKDEKYKVWSKANEWEIKAYLLIAYFYWEKWNENEDINDKEKFYNYLMFSYFISNNYRKNF